MQQSIVQEKSFKFAIRVINLYIYLKDTKKEYVLSKQILRSGTAIGAIIEEALGGQSHKDFLSKISIAYKEARETYTGYDCSLQLNILPKSNFVTLKQTSTNY